MSMWYLHSADRLHTAIAPLTAVGFGIIPKYSSTCLGMLMLAVWFALCKSSNDRKSPDKYLSTAFLTLTNNT